MSDPVTAPTAPGLTATSLGASALASTALAPTALAPTALAPTALGLPPARPAISAWAGPRTGSGRGSSPAAALRAPPLLAYPEQDLARGDALERMIVAARAMIEVRRTGRRVRRFGAARRLVNGHGPALAAMTDADLIGQARAVRQVLRDDPSWSDAGLAHGLAVVREAAFRVLGQRAFDVQILGALATLRGMVAEMATGEGKTLTATLAACVAGLGGVPVHLVTVNRYLAERDHAAAAPLHAFLGLTSGLVTEDVPVAARAAAYRCDITVCTNKDLAFDYLRDRIAAGPSVGRGNLRHKAAVITRTGHPSAPPPTLLRGLHFAIVDEADSVLIDEARTPLILSGSSGEARDEAVFDRGIDVARSLREGIDFAVLRDEGRVELSVLGQEAIAAALAGPSGDHPPPWDSSAERERLMLLALTALHTLHRGEHYLVRDGKAEIVDEYTGRVMADRTWSDGLQEMVERKEGLALSERRDVLARVTFQRFFRRYKRLAGMTGTASEVAGELWRVYRLPVAAIPANRPDAKRIHPPRAHATEADKWRAIAKEVAAIHWSGAPILIGTRTVEASRRASAALDERGLSHVVLSAAQDEHEAAIVARAGEPFAITVATNMAGRGTDIRLGTGTAALGGLRVIISEPHEARRIDRQLSGRCGRQGDPGEVFLHVCLDDALMQRHLGPPIVSLLRGMVTPLGSAMPAMANRLIRAGAWLAQRRAEALHARMRRDLLRSDEWTGDAMAFAGTPE